MPDILPRWVKSGEAVLAIANSEAADFNAADFLAVAATITHTPGRRC